MKNKLLTRFKKYDKIKTMKNKLNKRLEEERNRIIKSEWELGILSAQDLAEILNMSVQRIYQIIKMIKK